MNVLEKAQLVPGILRPASRLDPITQGQVLEHEVERLRVSPHEAQTSQGIGKARLQERSVAMVTERVVFRLPSEMHRAQPIRSTRKTGLGVFPHRRKLRDQEVDKCLDRRYRMLESQLETEELRLSKSIQLDPLDRAHPCPQQKAG